MQAGAYCVIFRREEYCIAEESSARRSGTPEYIPYHMYVYKTSTAAWIVRHRGGKGTVCLRRTRAERTLFRPWLRIGLRMIRSGRTKGNKRTSVFAPGAEAGESQDMLTLSCSPCVLHQFRPIKSSRCLCFIPLGSSPSLELRAPAVHFRGFGSPVPDDVHGARSGGFDEKCAL